MAETLFDLIIAKKIPSWTIWEDDSYIAFLTPFPNTPGATVVIPKTNQGDYIFRLSDEQLSGLILAAKKVANLLEKAFDVKRVASVVEGTEVPYVHVKLYPLHGDLGQASARVVTDRDNYSDTYQGYITTKDGPKMDDQKLDEIQSQILKAAK